MQLRNNNFTSLSIYTLTHLKRHKIPNKNDY